MPPPLDSKAVKAAALYCRLSHAPDGSVEKVERQEADSRVLADRLAWPVCCVFSDNSRSAWQRNRKRPAWDSMLLTLEPDAPHHHDAVVVYHGDRLIRQPWDLELLLRLADDRHLPLASTTGTRDLHNEDDRYILRIEAAGFCRSSADTSRRVRRGWEARAAKGMPVGGGKRPFGFEPDMVTRRESEASVLREAAERLMAGQTQGGVLAWMNTVSTTSQGNKWTSRSLKHLLLAPRIAGLVLQGEQFHQAVWDPTISVEEWEDIKLLLQQNAKDHPYPGRERRYLLTGIAECYNCGHPVQAKPTGGKNRPASRLYYCKNAECDDRIGRNVDHLDRYVTASVLRRLQDPELTAEALGPDPGIPAEIAALERRKQAAVETLRSLVDHPEISPAVIAESLAGFDRRIAELRNRHAVTARQRLLVRMAGSTLEQWEATPLDVQASTVRALLRVVILPATWRGPGFDPASVRLEPVSL